MVWWGIIASLAAGAMTAVGAIPILFGHKFSPRINDALLGFAAGVMLSASFFSLIVPGLELGDGIYGGRLISAAIAVTSILLGAGMVAMLNYVVPHEHFVVGRQGPSGPDVAKIWLFVLAITIHNIPEGLAVGIGYGGGDIAAGTTLAIGIGLQNLPEGLAVAGALLAAGYRRVDAFIVSALTGLVEPFAGLVGAVTVNFTTLIMPWALNFAAGAMLYVISHEIIPETHLRGHQNEATSGLMIGAVAMLLLDATFG